MRTSLKFYDPDGKEIDGESDLQILRKIEQLSQNDSVRVVKQETLPNGFFVSTVWIYTSMDTPPLIYETMIFNREGGEPVGPRRRYPNRAEAEKGHKEVVDGLIRKVN